MTQLDLWTGGVTESDISELVSLLRTQGWMHRRQLCPVLGWSERKIRAVAESAPSQIIRGQRGYSVIDRVDTETLVRCADALKSQGTKMLRVSVAWRRLAHARIG